MTKAEKINEFIRETLKEYSLDYTDFFEDTDNDMVEKVAKILGVAKKDILEMNDKAVMKWWKKYSYFKYIPTFNHARRKSFHNKDHDLFTAYFVESVFERPAADYPTRYDYENVIVRLDTLLKTMDKSIPGTYHSNAAMENLSISTERFFHFDQIDEMVESYLSMVNRVRELFYMAWDKDLNLDETYEYNFLVAAIGIQDRIYHREYLFYDLLKKFIPIYKSEGYTDFSSCARIDHQRVFKPWRCAEFSLNKDLVQRFVDIYPPAKKEMREFSLQVSKFSCYFSWSDAKPTISTQAELDEINDIAVMLGEDPVTFENCAKEPTLVYVPKTKEEMDGDDVFSKKLRALSGPVDLGGVYASSDQYKFTAQEAMRIQARIGAISQNLEGILHD